MGIQNLTEKDLISALRKGFPARSPDVVLGIGDDAAVVKIGNSQVLLTKDLLIEDHHFKTVYHPPALLGRKCLNVNLSDIAAMGGRPRFALLGLGIPVKTDPRWGDEFLKGLKAAAREASVQLVGGDVSEAKKITISVSIVGTTKSFFRRDGARPGDRIFVSGSLGNAKYGFLLLKEGMRLGEDRKMDVFINSFLDPIPRLALGQELARSNVPSAMIDISDGLSVDLQHICYESHCGAEIYSHNLPVSPVLKQKKRHYHDLALHGGEDYELLFTIPPDRLNRIARLQKKFDMTEIGCIKKETGIFLIDAQNLRKKLKIKGFQHFKI